MGASESDATTDKAEKMTDLEDDLILEELTTDTGQPPVSGHDAWVRERIQKRLEKKQAGTATYRTLDEVAAEFGFDAR